VSALQVTFVSADRTVWSGQASQVVVPAIDGSMGILPQMQPTLAILGDGVVRRKFVFQTISLWKTRRFRYCTLTTKKTICFLLKRHFD
jgi:hypothetical protein